MTRLDTHQQKKFMTKVVVYAIIIVALVAFLLTTGLKLLVNTTLFLSGMNSKEVQNAPIQQKKQKVFGTISLDSVPVATNSAQFYVSGSISGFDKISFYMNGEKIKEMKPNNDYFTEKIGDLHKGANEFYILAQTSQSSDTKQTNIVTIIYSSDKPPLDVNDPKDGSTTNKQEISVIGKTNKEIVIHVNDYPVVVDAQGKFQTTVRLKDGDNTIEITADDIAGNTETKTLHIKYSKDE